MSLALVLDQTVAAGNLGAWVPAAQLVLSARRGAPTVLDRPVLRPGGRVGIRPEQELTRQVPGALGSGPVRAVVLSSVAEGKAVKQWQIGRAGEADVLRDDRARFRPADLVDGFFTLVGGGH